MFRRALSCVVIVRLRTLSSWLPKHKGFARRYARESCYGFRVTSEVSSSLLLWVEKNNTRIVNCLKMHYRNDRTTKLEVNALNHLTIAFYIRLLK